MPKENDNKIDERVYSNLESYRANSQKNQFYSMQRIDLIIVSLSTGAIFGLLKVIDKVIISDSTCFKVAFIVCLLMFAFSIISNIISQVYSHRAHAIESKWASKEIERLNELIDKNEVESSTPKNKVVKTANTLSIIFLFAGIVISLILLTISIF